MYKYFNLFRISRVENLSADRVCQMCMTETKNLDICPANKGFVPQTFLPVPRFHSLLKGSLLYNRSRASLKHYFCWQNSWVHMSIVSKMCLLHESPFHTFNQNAHLHSNCLKWDIVTLLWSYCRDFCTLKFCDYENNLFFMISNWTLLFMCTQNLYHISLHAAKNAKYFSTQYLHTFVWHACVLYKSHK